MLAFAQRNLRIYFRDRSGVFFSLLGVLIIIALYSLFLGDMVIGEMQEVPHARFLMDSWIMAGVLSAASITTTMGAFGIMVEDRSKKVLKDFLASPLPRKSLTAGYILSTFSVGTIMSLVALVFAEGYIVAYGGKLFSPLALLKVIGLIFLSVAASNGMILFITSFLKGQNAFGTVSTIIGTFVGFVMGIYIPIGTLPGPMQYVVKLFPLSHAAALLRQVMMEAPLAASFAGAPAEILQEFKLQMGVEYQFGETFVTSGVSVLILIGTAALFYLLAGLNLSRKRSA